MLHPRPAVKASHCRTELEAAPDYVENVLSDGAQRARAVAEQTLARARKNSGLR